MKFIPKLDKATLEKRYKRFLADIRLSDGRIITIHCPNTGSMKNCAEPGSEVFYSTSDNPKRKYKHTWELTRTQRGHYIGVNTNNANRLVKEAVENEVIEELLGYASIRTEVKYGNENSRIDLLLEGGDCGSNCYVEVKSVTLLESPFSSGQGFFPDAISERGQKHIRELSQMVQEGHRAILFFCVQHSGIQSVFPAGHIDSSYAELLAEAVANGVEVLAYKCRMSNLGIRVSHTIPFGLDP